MDQSAFINLNILREEAKRELETFYEFLLFKYRLKIKKSKNRKDIKFKDFLSSTLTADHFIMPGREERNER